MVMEELMLVNPESTGRKRRRKQKPLQIIFPKPVRRLRANPEYIDRARTRSKALVGNLTGKHVAGSLRGAAENHSSPQRHEAKRLERCDGQRCCLYWRRYCCQAD